MKLTPAQWHEVLFVLISASGQPDSVVANLREVFKGSRSVSAAKELIHVCLHGARYWPTATRLETDAILQQKGLPPLAHLDTGFRDVCARVLKRGRIKTAEEFYVIAEILSGPDYDELSPDQRMALEAISGSYKP